ncbi:class II fructose-bisphosphatase [Ornithinibacillus californiensis]|uniref:class II fructose-bisphosphatase n=1 Tax=Ornithinibacillus californiensis TaxID=161536 RepID=UPI00064DCF17|nr:class II fructose-bisphosphatase [Ornithinibacillus californiensis]
MNHLLNGFLKVTEEAAIQTLPWVGRGDKIAADQAATTAMRNQLNQIEMDSVIVIGEGEIDEAPMLYIDEKVGKGTGPKLDIAVDPIDGTTPTVAGKDNGIAVIAAAPRGTLLHAPDMYMEKMIVGKEAKGVIDLEAPLLHNLKAVAEAKNKRLDQLCVVIQDRPRHDEAIQIMRENGVNVEIFQDGDVLKSLLPSINPEEYDMLYNVGGAPEGVLAAVAVKCLGGEMQARLAFRNEKEYERCLAMGLSNPKTVLRHKDLVASEQGLFIATAITDTLFLKGVKKESSQIRTQSLVIDHTTQESKVIESIRELV